MGFLQGTDIKWISYNLFSGSRVTSHKTEAPGENEGGLLRAFVQFSAKDSLIACLIIVGDCRHQGSVNTPKKK